MKTKGANWVISTVTLRSRAQSNGLVLSLRAEVKGMRKMRRTLEKTNAAIAGLKKQVGMLEQKTMTIFPLFCKACGKPLRADFNICPYCGLEINIKQEAVVREPGFSDKRRVNKMLKEKLAKGCQYWFGYLSQKEKDAPIPKECELCKNAVECMLNRIYSPTVIAEIKKLY